MSRATDNNDAKFEKDLLVKVILSWVLFIALSIGIFVFSNSQALDTRIVLFQEYHKSVIGLAAIFFAFSPTFYALIYSSEGIRKSMINSNLKRYFDEYFKLSSMFSAILVIMSVIGLILSYSKFNHPYWNTAKTFLFSLSFSAMAASFYWSYNYGKIAYNMIKYYTLNIKSE